MRVAVIGSGISGNACAWALKEYGPADEPLDLVMYERRERPGGHSATMNVDYDGKDIPVDIGFIVYNTLNYPNLVALFDLLGVETFESDMSFGVSMNNGKLEWAGKSLGSVFAQKRNALSPRFLRMLRDIFRFNEQAPQDLDSERLDGLSLGDYLHQLNLSKGFIDNYLAPMGAAIWSTPHADILDFPAKSFIRFLDNHRLMHRQRPRWRSVSGGSQNYVTKLIAPFKDAIRLGCEVTSVERKHGSVIVHDNKGGSETYDHVVFAAHTDQTRNVLQGKSPLEEQILHDIQYRPNTVYLHRDPALMPRRKTVWSAWNYIETPAAIQQETGVCVSYYMNALQKIDPSYPLFVSLNPPTPPRDDLIFHKTIFDHPQYDANALRAQGQVDAIQGVGNVWYCGAWCGYGFHEDGLKAGLAVAERLGARVPWRDYEESVPKQLEAAE